VRRSVTVDNPNIAVSLSFTDSRTGILKLRASASADTGVRSIEFFMNGSSLALLTAPNDGVWWSYSLDTRSFPVGPITVTAVATDNGGERAEVTQQHVIDNSPTLTLDSPVDGAVVSGALLVQGTITDDAPGATVTATLGDVQILAAGEGSFSTSFSLAGLAGGTYTLSVRAKDSAGRRTDIIRGVIVSSVNALAATLVGARAYRSKLLDTENGALLYSLELDPFGPTILRAANGGERTLTFAPGTGYADDWQLSAGRAVMRALGPPTTTRHIYAFDPSGLVRDLSLEVGSGNDDNHPVLRGAWVAWNADVIYNLDTRATYRVPTGGASSDFDLVATPGNEQLIFWAGNGGGAEILRYRLASGTTESLTSDGSLNVYPQSDGARVAWRRSPAGRTTTTPPFDLVVAPLENPAAATALSTSLDDDPGFLLRDGVLAWTEKPAAVPTLKIEDGAGAVVVSATASTRLYSNASGYVLFGENGKLYAWSRTRGKTLVLDALPRSVVQRNGIVFVATGMTDTAIHRIPLQ
jgi:hypothetical protein